MRKWRFVILPIVIALGLVAWYAFPPERGFAHKPGTTYGTAFFGVSERLISGYKSPNVCDLMAASPFPDSELQS